MLKYDTFWNTDSYVRERFGDSYEGYPLIFQDGPIEDGVFFSGIDEAVTVDPSVDKSAYTQLENRASQAIREFDEVNLINVTRGIYRAVGLSIEYSKSSSLPMFPIGEVVDLSYYLRSGDGVCLHQGIAAGWLLEKFMEKANSKARPA